MESSLNPGFPNWVPVVICRIMDMYQLRPRVLRVGVLVASRFQFQVIRAVYQAADD